MRLVALLLMLSATRSLAEPALEDLRRALPAGWTITTSPTTLTIARTATVEVSGRYLGGAHYGNIAVAAPPESVPEQLRFRFRTEPAWTPARRARVEAANARIAAELAPLRVRYRIDELATPPANPDEARRLQAYRAAHAAVLARLAPLPACMLGDLGVFVEGDTYAQLELMVVPAIAMREAYAIVELVKRRCAAQRSRAPR